MLANRSDTPPAMLPMPPVLRLMPPNGLVPAGVAAGGANDSGSPTPGPIVGKSSIAISDVLRFDRAANGEHVHDVRPRHLPAQHAIKIVIISDRVTPYAGELLGDNVILPAVLPENRGIEIVEINTKRHALRALELRHDVVVAALFAESWPGARAALDRCMRAHDLALRRVSETDKADWIG